MPRWHISMSQDALKAEGGVRVSSPGEVYQQQSRCARFKLSGARYRAWPADGLAARSCRFHAARGPGLGRNQRRTVTLTLPTLPLLSKARKEIVCSPGESPVRLIE